MCADEKNINNGEASSTQSTYAASQFNREVAQKADNLEKVVADIIGYNGAKIRDAQYTLLLNEYSSRFPREQDAYHLMKRVFFWSILVLFGVLIIGDLVLLFYSISLPIQKLEITLSYVVTALATLISGIIVLPKIIAKHLFPEKRENEILKLISTLIQDDCEIRKAHEERVRDYHNRNKF